MKYNTMERIFEATSRLFDAIQQNDLAEVKSILDAHPAHLLISNKADPTAADNWAISNAAIVGNIDIIQLLLDNNADLTVRNYEPIRLAAENNHIEVVKLLISQPSVCVHHN